jgi:hypothetical protein
MLSDLLRLCTSLPSTFCTSGLEVNAWSYAAKEILRKPTAAYFIDCALLRTTIRRVRLGGIS